VCPGAKSEQDACSKRQSLVFVRDEIWPVQVQARLDETFLVPSGRGSGRHTPTRVTHGFPYTSTQIHGVLIFKDSVRLEIHINKKFKKFCFLFNDIQLLP